MRCGGQVCVEERLALECGVRGRIFDVEIGAELVGRKCDNVGEGEQTAEYGGYFGSRIQR